VVFNNAAMAIERHALVVSHERYRTRDIGGHYADMGRAMGGYAERVDKPDEIAAALDTDEPRAGTPDSSDDDTEEGDR